MIAQLLCLAAFVAAEPGTDVSFAAASGVTFETALQQSVSPAGAPVPEFIVRGQTPYDENPSAYPPPGTGAAPFVQPYTAPGDPGAGQLYNPFVPWVAPPQPGNYNYDPFLGQPQGYDPLNAQPTWGLYGPQQYRYGWTTRFEEGWIPQVKLRDNPGSFEVFQLDTGLRYSTPSFWGSIFSWTPEFNLRTWEGPGQPQLPGQVYRFGSDLELAWQGVGPWSYQIGFTPQIVSDFEDNLNSDGYSFDARGVIFYRACPQLMFAFGAAYWDRVNDRVIPYAGVIWTPSDAWEFRLLFPKSRISVLVGNWFGAPTWLYASGEFNVEAYQVTIDDTGVKDRIELSDWRVMIGLRQQYGNMATFLEGGWVLDRQVDFKGPTNDFNIHDGFLIRAGVRF